MSTRHLLPLLLVALAAAPLAHAQYKWKDANGRMVYSDMPPPTSVAPSAVLQAPARPTPATDSGGSGATAKAAPAPAPAAAAAPVQSAADRELEFRKRRLEKAEAERKAAEEATRTKQTAAVCEDTRAFLRTLESGSRVAMTNAAGEREFIDDAQRTARIDQARESLRKHCPTT